MPVSVNQFFELATISENRTYHLPTGIPKEVKMAPKELASRFFQLASGHALTAPSLKEKFGWTESDLCWWCGSRRRTREHLFKERSAWKKEIRELWKEVGKVSGTCGDERKSMYKGRKGFFIGWRDRDGRVVRRPGNTSVRTLMSERRFVPTVLDFLSRQEWTGSRG